MRIFAQPITILLQLIFPAPVVNTVVNTKQLFAIQINHHHVEEIVLILFFQLNFKNLKFDKQKYENPKFRFFVRSVSCSFMMVTNSRTYNISSEVNTAEYI